MPLVLGGSAVVTPPYSIDNSCRFNDGDSPRMQKTFVAGDQDKWTFSCWIKKAAVALDMYLLACFDDTSNYTSLYFEAPNGNLSFTNSISGTYVAKLSTSSFLRDPSAWYNIVAVYDSGNVTAGDRMRLYVNGTEETAFSTDTNPALNEDSIGNKLDAKCIIGNKGEGIGGTYLDGYMAEAVFLDGTAAEPTSFGEFDSDSPTIWKPIDVSGLTFGTNGFYLDFKDSANLGNDANGGTDFTVTNLVAADQSQDSPTNNFCTLNPLDNYGDIGSPGVWSIISNGNNSWTTAISNHIYVVGTTSLAAGLWYWEIKTIVAGGFWGMGIGVSDRGEKQSSEGLGGFQAQYRYWSYDGHLKYNITGSSVDISYGDTWAADDIIGVYVDLNAGKLYFAKNDVMQNSGTGIAISVADTQSGFYRPAVADVDATVTLECNFGNGCFGNTVVTSAVADTNGYGLFEYDPSRGGGSDFDGSAKDFLAVCTKNLGSDGG